MLRSRSVLCLKENNWAQYEKMNNTLFSPQMTNAASWTIAQW